MPGMEYERAKKVFKKHPPEKQKIFRAEIEDFVNTRREIAKGLNLGGEIHINLNPTIPHKES